MTAASNRGNGAGQSWVRSQGARDDGGPDRVLVLDDAERRGNVLARSIAGWGYLVQHARSLGEVAGIMDDPRLSVVLLASSVRGPGGVHVLDHIRALRPDVAVLAMSRRPTLDGALACLRSGAFDFLVDPVGDPRELRAALRRALARGPSAVSPHVPRSAAHSEVPLSLEAYEKLALERALRESHGDATTAANRLGIGRSTFYRKAARHGIELSGPDLLRRRGRPRATLAGGVGATGPIS